MKFKSLLEEANQVYHGIQHHQYFLDTESDYERRKELSYLIAGFTGIGIMTGSALMAIGGIAVFAFPLIAKSKKLTETLNKSLNNSFFQKIKNIPTYLQSNNQAENTFRMINSTHMQDTVAINICNMTNNEGWLKVSLSDIPLLGLFDKWRKNYCHTAVLNQDFNLFLTEREIQHKIFSMDKDKYTIKHKPVVFISKQDNDVNLYIDSKIKLNTEKEKIEFFYHLESCLQSFDSKLSAHNKYIENYKECVNFSEIIENNKIIEKTSELTVNPFNVLIPCQEGRLTQLITQLDVSQLSESDIKSLNVIIAEINDKMNTHKDTEEYVELREQFRTALNQMITYYKKEDNNRQIKEQIVYLKERMYAKSNNKLYHKIMNKQYTLK